MILYLIKGGTVDIYSIGDEIKSYYKRFFENIDNVDQKQFTVTIDRFAKKGTIFNTRKFRSLGNGIYELKTQKNAERIYCFWSKRSDIKGAIVISHGTRKLKKKELNREKEKIKKIMNKFHNSGTNIKILEEVE